MPRTLFICPTYAHFDYAKRAVETFFQHSTEDDHCMVVDDASPGGIPPGFLNGLPSLPRLCLNGYPTHGGLTRSWNRGLEAARRRGFEYAICGNSDLLFTPHWHKGLINLLNVPGWKLAGPVTNCPGASQYGAQNVKHFYSGYQVSDEPEELAKVAEYLHAHERGAASVSHINGFFMMARTADWWEGRFDDDHVFNPYNEFNSKGQRCPDPLNCLNEDELQGRWRKKGWLAGFTASSFIFHYRAVSRGGLAAAVEGAYRLAPPAA